MKSDEFLQIFSEYHEFNIDMDDDRNAEDLPRGNTDEDIAGKEKGNPLLIALVLVFVVFVLMGVFNKILLPCMDRRKKKKKVETEVADLDIEASSLKRTNGMRKNTGSNEEFASKRDMKKKDNSVPAPAPAPAPARAPAPALVITEEYPTKTRKLSKSPALINQLVSSNESLQSDASDRMDSSKPRTSITNHNFSGDSSGLFRTVITDNKDNWEIIESGTLQEEEDTKINGVVERVNVPTQMAEGAGVRVTINDDGGLDNYISSDDDISISSDEEGKPDEKPTIPGLEVALEKQQL